MDRWNQYGTWSEFERRRAALIPGRVEVWIFALVVISLFGGRLLHCATSEGSMQVCMQDGMHRVIGMSLHTASLLVGIWAGPRIGLQVQRYWLGYVAGALIVVLTSASLVWLGFPITTEVNALLRTTKSSSESTVPHSALRSAGSTRR